MEIKKYKPLLAVYFNDPFGEKGVYTIPLSKKEVFLNHLAIDK